MLAHCRDHLIRFDSPIYFAGDTVKGTVHLVVEKPVEVRCLSFSWLGESRTGWFGNVDGDCTHAHIKDSLYLWHADDENTILHPACYDFPFAFRLPDDAPPTFSGAHGQVKYSVKLVLNRPNLPIWVFERKLVVSRKFPLHYLALKKQFHLECRTVPGLFSTYGDVEIKICPVDKIMIPGRKTELRIQLTNLSRVTLNGLEMDLYQYVHCHSRPQESLCRAGANTRCSLPKNRQRNEKNWIKGTGVKSLHLPPQHESIYVMSILIPAFITPTFNSPCFAVEYELKTTAITQGVLAHSVAFMMSVEIGHVNCDYRDVDLFGEAVEVQRHGNSVECRADDHVGGGAEQDDDDDQPPSYSDIFPS